MSGHRRRAESSGHHDRLIAPIRRTTTGAIGYDYYGRSSRPARWWPSCGVSRRPVRAPLVQTTRARRAQTQGYAELTALDERTLKDIGLSRSDVLAIASGLLGVAVVQRTVIRCLSGHGNGGHGCRPMPGRR